MILSPNVILAKSVAAFIERVSLAPESEGGSCFAEWSRALESQARLFVIWEATPAQTGLFLLQAVFSRLYISVPFTLPFTPELKFNISVFSMRHF